MVFHSGSSLCLGQLCLIQTTRSRLYSSDLAVAIPFCNSLPSADVPTPSRVRPTCGRGPRSHSILRAKHLGVRLIHFTLPQRLLPCRFISFLLRSLSPSSFIEFRSNDLAHNFSKMPGATVG